MKAVATLAFYAACAAAGVISLPWVLPLAGPFLIAFAAAAVMEPVVSALHKRGVSRSVAAGVLTVLLLVLLGVVVSLTVSNTFSALAAFAGKTPELLEALSSGLDGLQNRVLGLIRKAPPGLVEELTIAMDAVAQELYTIPKVLSETLLGFLANAAKRSPDLLLFTATTAIGVYFFSSSYRDIMDFIQRQLPSGTLHKVKRAWTGIRGACAGYLKVQVMLLGITFGELCLLFLVMRLGRPLLSAGVVALVDALPVLGSGTVLLPWSAYCLITGSTARGMELLIGYAAISAIRNAIQAKLMDDQLGLHPVVSLVCIYVGWKLAGLAGMIVLPIIAVVLQQLNALGVIRVWK